MNGQDHDAQHLITNRIYHEDTLLTQRTYNFLTLNVFLGAALIVGFDQSKQQVTATGYFVAIIGVIVAALQVALGRRAATAISFWRTYIRQAEKHTGLHLDHLLFQFYDKGEVKTPYGTITMASPGRPVTKTFPWNLMPSTNILYGVLLPWLVETVWFAVLVASLCQTNARWLAIIALIVWILGFWITWVWPLPSQPEDAPASRAPGAA